MAALALALARDGFALLPVRLPPPVIERLRRGLEPAQGSGHALRRLLERLPWLWPELEPLLGPTLRELLGPAARPVRGLLFDKIPGRNWAVPWHQDLTVACRARAEIPGFGPWSRKDGVDHAQAPRALLERMLALRIHLDPSPADGGALRVVPGSHRQGILDGPALRRLAARGRDLPCAAGAVLLMRPLLAHASAPARQPSHRRVIHLECAGEDLPPPLHWLEAAG